MKLDDVRNMTAERSHGGEAKENRRRKRQSGEFCKSGIGVFWKNDLDSILP